MRYNVRFGQYLVDLGIVSSDAVVKALRVQRERRVPFGRLCLQHGRLTVTQVFEILNLQSIAPHEMFGELCIESGYLSAADVAYILELQQKSRPPLGEILIEMDLISKEDLDELLESYTAFSGALSPA